MAKNSVTRRSLLTMAVGASVAGIWGRVANAAGLFTPTPPQMEGPFFPESLPLDRDNDLVRVIGKAAEAFGRVTHVGGEVVTPDGSPVPGALVEIWQCDNTGKYNHSGDTQPQPFDSNFQGYGRTITDDAGAYRFRTIRPVPYPGRAPHIHFKVAAAGFEPLTSQMYVAGDPLNLRDGIFMRETPADRKRLLVTLSPASQIENGALAGNFRIVLKPV